MVESPNQAAFKLHMWVSTGFNLYSPVQRPHHVEAGGGEGLFDIHQRRARLLAQLLFVVA
jgi:hypothetical protein